MANFIVQEIQTDSQNVTALLPPEVRATYNEAESAYFTTLAAAAISSVEVHSVLLIGDHGNTVRRDFYEHLTD